MKNWFRRKSPSPVSRYDPETEKPVLLCSICTGEQTAGFQYLRTGKFTGVMRISSPRDLESFRRQYGIETDIPKIY